jgi:hypothetical protein
MRRYAVYVFLIGGALCCLAFPGSAQEGRIRLAVMLGLTGSGVLLLKVGGWYFEHRSGSTKSMGAAGVLVGVGLLILSLTIIWIERIQHLLR